MLRTIKAVTECDISATDGPIGQVCGAYFDDEAWVVRYLVVETVSTRGRRSVLIPPIALGQPRWSERLLPVSMSKRQIMHSPDANTQKPVSREHALNCLNYYAGLGYRESDAEYQRLRTTTFSEFNRGSGRTADDDPHLRSTGDVMTCRLDAADGDIGQVLGLLVDENSWAIRFMIVNTSAWWGGHQVLIAPESIDDVHWGDSHVVVDLKRQNVKESPTYDVDAPFDNEQGESTYRHYGLEGYKPMENSVC
jgi:hypothetical protein